MARPREGLYLCQQAVGRNGIEILRWDGALDGVLKGFLVHAGLGEGVAPIAARAKAYHHIPSHYFSSRQIF